MAPEDAAGRSTRQPRKSTGQSPVRKRSDKENVTLDVASSFGGTVGRPKSRSKSVGPGGLDALKPTSGNRRVSLAAPTRPPPRSILKPTIPVLPETPLRTAKPSRYGSQSGQGIGNLQNLSQTEDFNSGVKIAVRTEEQQHAASREREEKERAEMEQEIKDRREARRKSLANRRVSFAAEATLHTFQVVEYMQDSTTSTDNTRRTSRAAHPTDLRETPEESESASYFHDKAAESSQLSPEKQPDRQRGRDPVMPAMNYSDPDETLASATYSSDSDGMDGVIETREEITGSDSDADIDGVTTDLVVDEVTGTSADSASSARTVVSDDESDSLDDVLRLAARQAQTQNIDENEVFIPSFGWARQPALEPSSPLIESSPVRLDPDDTVDMQRQVNDAGLDTTGQDTGLDMDMDMDMDMTEAVGGILASNYAVEADPHDENEDMSMDVTNVLGGILGQRTSQIPVDAPFPDKLDEDVEMEDSAMEMTMALGGIRNAEHVQHDVRGVESNGDEDMSMEFTNVIGRVLSLNRGSATEARRSTVAASGDEATMDLTSAVGRILPANEQRDEEAEEDDAVTGMEMNVAMGGFVTGASPVQDRRQAKKIMEQEVDGVDRIITSAAVASSSTPLTGRISAASKATDPAALGTSGSSAFVGKGLRRSTVSRGSLAPRPGSPLTESSPLKFGSPAKATLWGSPAKATPPSNKPSTPVKNATARHVPRRSVSPQRTNADIVTSTPKSTQEKTRNALSVFSQDASTGVSTPRVVLTPQRPRLSGVGADRPGWGSPRVAELLERRESIGDTASDFVPSKTRGVTFADPRVMEEEIDEDQQNEDNREIGRRILEREADGAGESTSNRLKDMIASMTPKKSKPLRGRKSLHVGSAMGVLGKRPAELDDDDDAEDRDGVKRLKGHQPSPVKSIRLQAPPSKEETTGRMTRSARRGLADASGNTTTPTTTESLVKGANVATSPRNQGRFRDVESDQPASTLNFQETAQMPQSAVQVDGGQERINLQEFLNMTSIRFMELTTTKRRQTHAAGSSKDKTSQGGSAASLEERVVAAACTVPNLDLYQHSCRELKKYISEGRSIVREIERETAEENPPLFREYMSATAEFKTLMDNQFKNVKTNARLLSKAMWYEWRMKLQDGLKEGLVKMAEDMQADDKVLLAQEELLNSFLPDLDKHYGTLEEEYSRLQSEAQELEDCDPHELQEARTQLSEVDADIAEKLRQIEELKLTLSESESAIDDATKRKQECLAAIKEAEKVREECRGWTSTEINALQANVDKIEKEYGWAVAGITGTNIRLTYLRELELIFDVAAFKNSSLAPKNGNSPIELSYMPANRTTNPQPASVEKDFFLGRILDYVRTFTQVETRTSRLLGAVSGSWEKTRTVEKYIYLVNCTFQTQVVKAADSSLAVNISMLLVPLQTKVMIYVALQPEITDEGFEIAIVPHAKVIFGEQFQEDKIDEFLSTKMGSKVVVQPTNDVAKWSDILLELRAKLIAKGQKK